MGIDIADVRRRKAGAGERQRNAAGGLDAVRAGLGHVRGIIGGSVRENFAVNASASRLRVVPFFQQQHRRAFRHHKAVPACVKGPGCCLRVVVALAHGPDNRKRAVAEGRQGRFRAARKHGVRAAVPDEVHGPANRNRRRRAGIAVRRRRAGNAQLNRNIARSCAVEDA